LFPYTPKKIREEEKEKEKKYLEEKLVTTGFKRILETSIFNFLSDFDFTHQNERNRSLKKK